MNLYDLSAISDVVLCPCHTPIVDIFSKAIKLSRILRISLHEIGNPVSDFRRRERYRQPVTTGHNTNAGTWHDFRYRYPSLI